MSFDLSAIHTALADQIAAGIADDVTVKPYPFSGANPPFIEIWPGGQYVDYAGTFGADGLGDIQLEIHVAFPTANGETTFKVMTRLLSVGTGFSSSIADAVMADRTLGGVVQDCVALEAQWDIDPDALGQIATIPVRIIAKKQGAEV